MNRVIPGGSLRDEFRFLKFEFHGFAISCIRGRPGNNNRSTSQAILDKQGGVVVSQMGHTTPEEFNNTTITRHFGIVFEENSGREIT